MKSVTSADTNSKFSMKYSFLSNQFGLLEGLASHFIIGNLALSSLVNTVT